MSAHMMWMMLRNCGYLTKHAIILNVEQLFIYLFTVIFVHVIVRFGHGATNCRTTTYPESPKNSGQNFLYCTTFCFKNTVGLMCFWSEWNKEFSAMLVKGYVRLQSDCIILGIYRRLILVTAQSWKSELYLCETLQMNDRIYLGHSWFKFQPWHCLF
jgi:hypothetical protein